MYILLCVVFFFFSLYLLFRFYGRFILVLWGRILFLMRIESKTLVDYGFFSVECPLMPCISILLTISTVYQAFYGILVNMFQECVHRLNPVWFPLAWGFARKDANLLFPQVANTLETCNSTRPKTIKDGYICKLHLFHVLCKNIHKLNN